MYSAYVVASMGRFTITLNDEQQAWVDDVIERTGATQSEVVRRTVDLARGEDVSMFDAGGVPDDVVAEVDELEQRVAELEQRLTSSVDEQPVVEQGVIGRVDDDDQEDSDDVDAGAVDPADLPAVPDDLDEQVDALDVPGGAEKQQRRREGVRLSLAFLIHRQEAYRSEFEEFLDRDDVPHGYASGHSAYKNYVNDALKDLARGDDRLRPSAARDPWRWVG